MGWPTSGGRVGGNEQEHDGAAPSKTSSKTLWVTFPWSVRASAEGAALTLFGWVDPTSVHSTPQPSTGKGETAWLQEPGVLAGSYVQIEGDVPVLRSSVSFRRSERRVAANCHDDAGKEPAPLLEGAP